MTTNLTVEAHKTFDGVVRTRRPHPLLLTDSLSIAHLQIMTYM